MKYVIDLYDMLRTSMIVTIYDKAITHKIDKIIPLRGNKIIPVY